MIKQNFEKLLQEGINTMGLSLSAGDQSKLIAYLQLMQQWNKAYNLTAITEMEKMISHHLLDSLSISPYLVGEQIVDVGSGAGLPGIPLAVYFPGKQFTLIDSVGKKTRFISQVARELGLNNVRVLQTRAEEYPSANRFDTMMARAVASIETLVSIAKHLLAPDGELLMMKSNEKPDDVYHAQIETLVVPGVETSRTLIIIRNLQ